MDEPVEAPPALFDHTGVIIADTACRRCDYNLRGLHRDGRCPECGTPIGLSTHGDLLRFADPSWVDKLALGMKYMIWGIVIEIGVGLVGGCLTQVLRASQAPVQAVGFLAELIGLYGAWLVTAPDPSGIGEDRYVTSRKIVRIALLVGLLSSATRTAVQALPTLPKSVFVLLLISIAASALIGLVGQFAKLTYLSALADRIPNPSLARRGRFLRWALTICTAGLVVGGALAAVGARSAGVPGFGPLGGGVVARPSGPSGVSTGAPPPTGTPTSSLPATGPLPRGSSPFDSGPFMDGVGLLAIAGLAVLVFQVMAFVMFIQLGRRFREQAGIARQTWAAAVQGSPIAPPPTPPPNS